MSIVDIATGSGHLRCVLLQPAVGCCHDNNPTRHHQLGEAVQECHRVRQSADQVGSQDAAKLVEGGAEVTGISHCECDPASLLQGRQQSAVPLPRDIQVHYYQE